MAWRRRKARSLVAFGCGPEPFTGCFRAPARLRLLWRAAWDVQDYWRAVRTWNAGGCSDFWRIYPHVKGDVRAMQRVEGSEQGLISHSQRLYYLLCKGQSNDSSCPKPDRATQRSSLDESCEQVLKERVDPEKLTRRDLVVVSLLMLGPAGLYSRPSSAWSRRSGRSEL